MEKKTMKSSAKDRVEGAFHRAKGKVKEVAGKISGDRKSKVKGTAEKVAGKVQEAVGKTKKVFGK